MTNLGEIIDAWATSQKGQFVIVYGPHRPWPGDEPKAMPQGSSTIVCQWCARVLGTVFHESKRISLYPHQFDDELVPAHPDFFEKLRAAIRGVHKCVGDKYVQA